MSDYSVDRTHPEYDFSLSQWNETDDFCGGEKRVKTSPDILEYIPNPNTNKSDPNRETQYNNYVELAPFLAFASRTAVATASTINRKNPDVSEISKTLEYLIKDANGEGLTLDQHISMTVNQVVKKARFGLLTELPTTDNKELSLADNEAGMMPVIKQYDAQSIRYWKDDGSLVILRETVEENPDAEFGSDTIEQYRVLLIEDGVYKQRLYKDNDNLNDFTPVDVTFGGGQSFNYIPFDFVGAQNNDSSVDTSSLYDIVVLNKTHFRASALAWNIMQMCSFAMTSISTRMTDDQINKRFPNGISYGSSQINFFPENTKIEMNQANESNLASAKVDNTLQEAITIGAKIVQPREQETATAAMIADTADNSIIGQIAQNVDSAYNNQLANIALVLGDSQESKVSTNKETGLAMMTPEMLRAQMEAVLLGTIAEADLRRNMRKAGMIDEDRTDEDIDKDTETDTIPVVDKGVE